MGVIDLLFTAEYQKRRYPRTPAKRGMGGERGGEGGERRGGEGTDGEGGKGEGIVQL